jgi:hypothetical protein
MLWTKSKPPPQPAISTVLMAGSHRRCGRGMRSQWGAGHGKDGVNCEYRRKGGDQRNLQKRRHERRRLLHAPEQQPWSYVHNVKAKRPALLKHVGGSHLPSGPVTNRKSPPHRVSGPMGGLRRTNRILLRGSSSICMCDIDDGKKQLQFQHVITHPFSVYEINIYNACVYIYAHNTRQRSQLHFLSFVAREDPYAKPSLDLKAINASFNKLKTIEPNS